MRKKLHITLDAADNTITLSPALAKELRVSKGLPVIFVFRFGGTREFAFKRVPTEFMHTTPCGIVSYNQQVGAWGFVSHCPTVNLMLFDMGLDINTPQKLGVEKTRLPDKSYIYKILSL